MGVTEKLSSHIQWFAEVGWKKMNFISQMVILERLFPYSRKQNHHMKNIQEFEVPKVSNWPDIPIDAICMKSLLFAERG